MLLLPSANQVELVRRELVLEQGVPGLWRPRILTFPELAAEVFDCAGFTAPQVSIVGERSIMRLVVRRLDGWLSHLAKVKECPGLVEALCDFVGELKRAGVAPDGFRRHLEDARFLDTRGRELCRIYIDFQDLLHELGLFDVEGRFWMARELLETDDHPLDWPQEIYVDGFENFTTTQLEMLSAMARRADTLVFTLTYDAVDERRDFFETTHRTYQALLERFPGAKAEAVRGSGPDGPTGHLCRNLFRTQPETARPTDAIQIIETPGRRREVEAIGRRIKGLLLDGVPPESIGVLYRSLEDYGEVFREVFTRFGIPIRMGQWMTAESQTVCRAVLSMLRIAQRDFQLTDVTQFLNSVYVRHDPLAEPNGPASPQPGDARPPSDRPSPGAQASCLPSGPADEFAGGTPAFQGPGPDRAERMFTPDDLADLAVRARIAGGRDQWVPRLQSALRRWQAALENRDVPPEEDQPEPESVLQTRIQRASQAIRYTEAFIDTFEVLPREGTHGQFVEATLTLLNAFRIPSHLVDPLAPEASSANVQAFRELIGVLNNLVFTGSLLTKAAGEPFVITLAEFSRDVRTGLGHAVFQAEGSRLGRVNILEAHQARQLTFRYVFLGGLVEKRFPKARTEDVFYRDGERQKLVEVGLMLQERLPQQREEATLFYGAICAAEELLTLSYPTTDAEGKEILTSYYVDELRRCFDGEVPTTKVRLSEVVPDYAELTHHAELMERASLDPGREPLDQGSAFGELSEDEAGRLRDAIQNAEAGAGAESARESAEPFGRYDGVLGTGEATSHLSERFGPSYHFSAHQLNSMGSCPFQYFAGQVLGLSPREEVAEEADDRERGLAAHAILARFFREGEDEAGLGTRRITAANLSRAKELLGQVTSRYFHERRRLGLVGDIGLWEIERRVMGRHLESLLEFEAETHEEDSRGGGSFAPTHLEYVFGGTGDKPLELGTDDQPILVDGRVDRVDLSAGEEPSRRFRVWDYKTGRSSHPRNAIKGTDFQLPIYVLAAQQNLFGEECECESCGFYVVQRPISQKARALAGPGRRGTALEDVLASTRDWLPKLVEQIRSGRFPVAPREAGVCQYCDYRGICRVNRFRAVREMEAEERERVNGDGAPD